MPAVFASWQETGCGEMHMREAKRFSVRWFQYLSEPCQQCASGRMTKCGKALEVAAELPPTVPRDRGGKKPPGSTSGGRATLLAGSALGQVVQLVDHPA
eukprot:5357393-Alexandrium_andersonii.AAC.1